MWDVYPPIKNILLVSVFITNKALNPTRNLGQSRTGSKIERLEIFLTCLRSWSKLQIGQSFFFIELDEEFVQYQDLIATEIDSRFANSKVKWNRLLHFKEWSEISTIVAKEADLIVLIANDDHGYVHSDQQPFLELCAEVLEVARQNDNRALGDLTHLPGNIRRLAFHAPLPMGKGMLQRLDEVTTIHGCCLVTPKLFAEWWMEDFTEGKRIPRPDNPFGPSVKFIPANVLTPRVEILRHLDGYGEGTRISRKYNVLRPTCRILESRAPNEIGTFPYIQEIPWKYSLWPETPSSYGKNLEVDLYNMFPLGTTFFEKFRVDLSRLVVAYQKVYAPQLSREFLRDRNSNFLYVGALNTVVLLEFAIFFNFLTWLVFDIPNQLCIRVTILLFGKNSLPVKLCRRIRNRIYQHISIKLLKSFHLFSN